MKIAIATVQVPFIKGGAEYLCDGLIAAIKEQGHAVDLITLPFKFNSRFIRTAVESWEEQDFNTFDVGSVDAVICLKFPAYNLSHDKKVVWLLHQHRAVYDLFNTEYGENENNQSALELREYIINKDNDSLRKAHEVFTISKVVSDRLKKYNNVKSKVLYHPPPYAEIYKSGPIFPYIFSPSRLESLKRQDLLIKAMPYINKNIFFVIAGVGGQLENYRKLAKNLNVENRIKFVGHISDMQKARYYSNSLAVFFGPFQEDLGYVTFEAMLSAKPVITCNDSGGPLEFINHEQTGFVVDPEPIALAEKVNYLWCNLKKSEEIGINAKVHYENMDICWNNVVNQLLKEV